MTPSADGGGDAPEPGRGVDRDAFRDALALWASGVTVVAVRDAGRVHATTATAFASVSAEPPLVLVSLGPGAQALPFLDEGAPFAVSVLAAGQRSVATVYADAYPVGPSPFPPDGPPVVEGALVALACRVRRVHEAGDHRLVVGLVEGVVPGASDAARPLLYWDRGYRELP